jgi:hypothetical protein
MRWRSIANEDYFHIMAFHDYITKKMLIRKKVRIQERLPKITQFSASFAFQPRTLSPKSFARSLKSQI